MDVKELQKVSEFRFVMDCVKTTLSSTGKARNDSDKYVDSGVFQDDDVARAVVMSMADLRQNGAAWLPDYPQLLISHSGILALGASQYLLAGHSLLEAGRNFSLTGGGVDYEPPPVADAVMRVYLHQSALYSQALERFASR